MQKFKLTLILSFCLVLGIFAQTKDSGFDIGNPDVKARIACDTLRGEQIYVEKVGSLTCCYDEYGAKMDPCPGFKLGPCKEDCWIPTGKVKCLEASSVFAETFVPVPANSTFTMSDPDIFQLGTFLSNAQGIRNVNDLILTCLSAGSTADVVVSDFGNTYTTTIIGFVDSVTTENSLLFNYVSVGNSADFSNRITSISVTCEGGSDNSIEVCQFISCDLTEERWLAGTEIIEEDSLQNCSIDSTLVNYFDQYKDSCCTSLDSLIYNISTTNFQCSKVGFNTIEAFTSICPAGWTCSDLADQLNAGNPTGTQFTCNAEGNLTVVSGDPPDLIHFSHSGGGSTTVFPEGDIAACRAALATKECNSDAILMTLEQIAEQSCENVITSNVVCASTEQSVELSDGTTVTLTVGQELLLTRVLDCDGSLTRQ